MIQILRDTTVIDGNVAVCDGGQEPAGHPKIYLNFDPMGKVVCPYCSQIFIRGNAQDHKP